MFAHILQDPLSFLFFFFDGEILVHFIIQNRFSILCAIIVIPSCVQIAVQILLNYSTPFFSSCLTNSDVLQQAVLKEKTLVIFSWNTWEKCTTYFKK